MVAFLSKNSIPFQLFSIDHQTQMRISRVHRMSFTFVPTKRIGLCPVKCSQKQTGQHLTKFIASEQKVVKNAGKKEHHLWSKRDSAGSGSKALNLVKIVSGLPNEKEAVYGALDKWTAWELEFPVIAAVKALQIFRNRSQWKRVIQVFADMEELGVKPDEDTVRKVARAFRELGEHNKQNMVLKTYLGKWKYIHFKGDRVRVRRDAWAE